MSCCSYKQTETSRITPTAISSSPANLIQRLVNPTAAKSQARRRVQHRYSCPQSAHFSPLNPHHHSLNTLPGGALKQKPRPPPIGVSTATKRNGLPLSLAALPGPLVCQQGRTGVPNRTWPLRSRPAIVLCSETWHPEP
jgi:hypothetical protein